MNDFPLSELEAEQKRLETEDSEDIEDAEQMTDRGKPNVIQNNTIEIIKF